MLEKLISIFASLIEYYGKKKQNINPSFL